MKTKKKGRVQAKGYALKSAKECAFIAVFVALTIAAQLVLSAVPGVEAVTVLFCAYAFTFGIKRGMTAATAFSLLRQLLFGFYPTVLILYFLYYNILSVAFALLGKKIKRLLRYLPFIMITACVCTVFFTLMDNVLTPLWYRYSARATRAYFIASLPFMGVQTLNAGITVGLLFFPLQRAFATAKRSLF